MSTGRAHPAPQIAERLISLADQHAAHTYHPLPVVLSHGEGAWVVDVDGRRYLDGLCGYSALNFGHRHPALVAAAHDQLDRLTLTSRAFHHDRFGPFVAALAALTNKQMVVPMNSGAEAVETGIKLARKWGYEVRGVPAGQAEVIITGGSFHGRTISIVSFSDDPTARDGFGPFTPGFVRVPYGDVAAIEAAMTPRTVGVLLEPIQGERGVVIPPEGYLRAVRALTSTRGVLMLADEIQSGLGRTGATFACDHEDVVPDVYILGKALGGGILPVSAVVADEDVLGVLRPGQHGSTFGGNPMACAVGLAVIDLLQTGDPQRRARAAGELLTLGLADLHADGLLSVRARGLWAGIDIDPALASGRRVCELLLDQGVLAKETHGSTIRLAPSLLIDDTELTFLLDALRTVLAQLSRSS